MFANPFVRITFVYQGGSGVALDWTRLQTPAYASKGWLLAGGLNPDNVASALSLSSPAAVDVSSGVCGPDGELGGGE